VLDTCEVLADEQLRRTGMIVHLDHPGWGELRVPGCPIRIDGCAPRIAAPPHLDQHAAEVFGGARSGDG
jgi:crotonobetainyl-CoA:carnitine CoA-transferase CaiB-like acyl-CoA transferase